MAWKFEANHLYRVRKEWRQDVHPSMRADRILVYDLHVGDVFRFRGSNMGNAEFLDSAGRLLIISSRIAFDVLEPANKRVQPNANRRKIGRSK